MAGFLGSFRRARRKTLHEINELSKANSEDGVLSRAREKMKKSWLFVVDAAEDGGWSRLANYMIFKFARLAASRLIPTDSNTTSTISSSS